MKAYEFFQKYANTQLKKRYLILDLKEGVGTLNTIYDELMLIQDAMRPLKIKRDKLLDLAERGFEDLEDK